MYSFAISMIFLVSEKFQVQLSNKLGRNEISSAILWSDQLAKTDNTKQQINLTVLTMVWVKA